MAGFYKKNGIAPLTVSPPPVDELLALYPPTISEKCASLLYDTIFIVLIPALTKSDNFHCENRNGIFFFLFFVETVNGAKEKREEKKQVLSNHKRKTRSATKFGIISRNIVPWV